MLVVLPGRQSILFLFSLRLALSTNFCFLIESSFQLTRVFRLKSISLSSTNCVGVASVALLYEALTAQATETSISPKGSR